MFRSICIIASVAGATVASAEPISAIPSAQSALDSFVLSPAGADARPYSVTGSAASQAGQPERKARDYSLLIAELSSKPMKLTDDADVRLLPVPTRAPLRTWGDQRADAVAINFLVTKP